MVAGLYFLGLCLVFVGCLICAISGDSVGYWTGKKMGPRIFSKPDSFFFSQKNIEKTKNFYDKYGKKTIILSRFVPIVRTFAPILAGVGNMEYKNFISYNILGGFIWVSLMIFSGYFLGNSIENIDQYILPITAVIILLSFLPVLTQFVKGKKNV